MATFYFREDMSTDEARIHSARCGHAVRGVGRQERAAFRNTTARWHGPYETQEQAGLEAGHMGLTVVACGACL